MAYSGLAKLRGDFLGSDDVAAMRKHLHEMRPDEDGGGGERFQFALGQALEKIGDYGGAFVAYEASAALAKDPDYDPADDIREMHRRCAVFTSRNGYQMRHTGLTHQRWCVRGMPRAGSTLVEVKFRNVADRQRQEAI